jgi:predicted DNA-binding transcriptional regulator AlpA
MTASPTPQRRTILPKVPEDRCLRTKALLEYCGGIGRTTLHVWRRDKGFPRPIEVSRRLKLFRKAEVDAWLAQYRQVAA